MNLVTHVKVDCSITSSREGFAGPHLAVAELRVRGDGM